jgi:hypothetical protein
MKVNINKEHFRTNVIDKIGASWRTKLKVIYTNDFDRKSVGGSGMSGTRWAPLKRETIRQKIRIGSPYPNRILRRFGKLRTSIKVIYTKKDASIKIYVDEGIAPYSKYHNSGSSQLPKRVLLDEPNSKVIEDIKEDVNKATLTYIADMFKQLKSKNINVTGFNY